MIEEEKPEIQEKQEKQEKKENYKELILQSINDLNDNLGFIKDNLPEVPNPQLAESIMKFGAPVNILYADTKNVGGVAKGEMTLGLPEEKDLQEAMIKYLADRGLEIEEVTDHVE